MGHQLTSMKMECIAPEGGGYSAGTNTSLLGILYAGPMFSIEGKIIQKDIPTDTRDVPVINSMLNLGYVIRVDEIESIRELMNLSPHTV